MIQRYKDGTRLNHWFVALLFFCAALSGLALFHPSLFWLVHLFGGGPWARILHPFMGVLMVLGFLGLFFAMWRENVIDANDRAWLAKAGELARGNKAAMPPVGKYNGGQKVVFWLFALSLLVLLATGFVFWSPWFVGYFPIGLRRVAVLLHAFSAVVLVLSAIVHVYAAIWVKGTIRAMTRGEVSDAWARKNHPLWHRQVTGGK